MSRPKKEYNNIFAKMCEHHNNDVVPILKSLKLSTVKIRPRRILNLRDTLEVSEDVSLSIDIFTEYLILNTFVFNIIDKSELQMSYDLINSKIKENVYIGINCIYQLIEAKKEEIKTKLNE